MFADSDLYSIDPTAAIIVGVVSFAIGMYGVMNHMATGIHYVRLDSGC